VIGVFDDSRASSSARAAEGKTSLVIIRTTSELDSLVPALRKMLG